MVWLEELVAGEDGQDLIEYGLLAAVISLAVISSIELVGTALGNTYDSFSDDIENFGS